ncbi:MAG: nicotinate-nucleotide--dimethylbenzimidazole phosphoribosyltransferase [Hyphomicrobiaceae bacterium]
MIHFDRLSDVADLIADLPKPDAIAMGTAKARQATLTKPPGSLGRLEELALFMAGWRATPRPEIKHAQALVFAGNHGVCAQGVNAFPQSVTAQMVQNFETGGAAINQLCQINGAALSVIALEQLTPTRDFTIDEAMTEPQVVDALNRGANAVRPVADILILGEMGIGNSTVAAALCAALFGGPTAQWVGPGTGSGADGVALKIASLESGLARHASLQGNPLAVLQAYGGHEQAALCGAILAARLQRTPVILDGYICTAAAGILHALNPSLLDHCLVGHMSGEPGHHQLLKKIGKRPLLDLDMRLGEGTGAALALSVLRAALTCHNGMATFAEAGVSTQ